MQSTLPQIKESVMMMSIASDEPDAKQCLETGAAVLLDKPIIVIIPPGRQVSTNLKRCASAIIEGNPSEPGFQERLQATIIAVIANDQRAAKRAKKT
jgi:hypothetical protein